MTEEKGQAPGDVEPDERGTKQYCANFDASADTVLRLRQLLHGLGCRGRADELAVFGGRVRDHAVIRMWKTGHRNVPAWAVAMLQSRTAFLAERAAGMKAGPGSKAGRRNLRRGNWPR